MPDRSPAPARFPEERAPGVFGVDRILVLSSPTFDFSSHAVPDNVRRPLALVAFSSGFQDQAASMRRAVEALSGLPVRAVATLGRALDPDDVSSPENVHVVRSAPHEQILEDASLAVIHCGHGTTMRSLLAGVPLVCMPMGRDQDDTAARIVHHGAGVRVSPDAGAAAIRGTSRPGHTRPGAGEVDVPPGGPIAFCGSVSAPASRRGRTAVTTMADALTPTAWRRSAVSRTTLDVVLVLAGSGLVALAVLPLVWRLLGRDAPWADDSSG